MYDICMGADEDRPGQPTKLFAPGNASAAVTG